MKITIEQLKEEKNKVTKIRQEQKQYKCWTNEYAKLGQRLNRQIAKYKKLKGSYFYGNN